MLSGGTEIEHRCKMSLKNETLCVRWYHFYKLKNLKNTHGIVLPLVNLQAKVCKFNKSSTHP